MIKGEILCPKNTVYTTTQSNKSKTSLNQTKSQFQKSSVNNGIKDKSKYNQVANFTYLDTTTNIAVSDDEPCQYFTKVWEQCKTGEYHIGNLKTEDAIKKNLSDNCIPEDIKNWTSENYEEFLAERRKMMATKIRNYYEKL